MKKYNVAIMGATGAVGQEFLNLIEERKFPFAELRLLASSRSAGKKIAFMGKEYTVAETREDSFEGIDIALFAGGGASKTFAPAAVKAGAVVIDNSSTFRMDKDVPLVVPEVNPEALKEHKGIIANPNCSTIIMAELEEQVEAIVAKKPVKAEILPGASLKKHYQIAFNLIPQIDVFKENLYTKEEMKMIDETRKILSEPDLRVTATTVRVPVYRSHAESVNIEFAEAVSVEAARKAIAAFPGAALNDDPDEQAYPMPLFTSGKDDVEVGRIRLDESVEHGLNLWVCGDQIRKGAALNALQIAEYMIEHGMIG